jgi:hypothetical protein
LISHHLLNGIFPHKFFSPQFFRVTKKIFAEKNSLFKKKPKDDGSNQSNARHGKEARNGKKASYGRTCATSGPRALCRM